jgi:hypothetical protein
MNYWCNQLVPALEKEGIHILQYQDLKPQLNPLRTGSAFNSHVNPRRAGIRAIPAT